MLLGLGAVIGTLAVIGPWLTWVVGALMARLGRRPAPVLAGRRITDDARGTYRTVSGMVLAGLIAGFLFGVVPTIRSTADQVDGLDRATGIDVSVDGPREGPAARDVAAAVAATGARVEWSESDDTATWGSVASDRTVDPEVVRTAILGVAPTAWIGSTSDIDHEANVMVDDMRRASIVMSLAALLLAAAATAIGSTASILDQRVTLTRLRLAGTSLRQLQRARRWQALVPLGLASIGAMVSGAAAAQVLMRALGGRERVVGPDLAPMVALGVAALLVGCLAVAGTRPVLVAATRSTPRE